MPFNKKDIAQINDLLSIFKAKESYGIYYQNIAFVGLACLLVVSSNLKNSLIPIDTLLWIGGVSSVLVTLVFIRFYKRELGIIWSLFHNLTIGVIVVAIFIYTNDYLSTNPEKKQICYIEKTELVNTKSGRRGSEDILVPHIRVKLEDKTVKLKLKHEDLKPVQKTRNVEITYKKGLYNYLVISDIKLK